MLVLDDLPMAAALVAEGVVSCNREWVALDRAGSRPLASEVVVAIADAFRRGDEKPVDRLDVETGNIERLVASPTHSGSVLVLRSVVTGEYDMRSQANAASTDALTGLAKRDAVEHALADARDGESASCVLFIDLDGFKEINDTLGHAVGDEILIAVAARLVHSTRASDVVARWGGDEFVVVLTGVDEAAAWPIVTRLAEDLNTPVRLEDRVVPLTASIGCAPTAPDESVESVIERADDAMYRAKARRQTDRGAGGLEVSRRGKVEP